MQIVLDTNVIVFGLLNPGGYPGAILDAVISGAIDLAVNDAILFEYHRVLNDQKFPFSATSVRDFLEYVRFSAHYVSASPAEFKSSDQIFVDVLFSSNANYLVTGNLKDFKSIAQVISPKEFALSLGQKRR